MNNKKMLKPDVCAKCGAELYAGALGGDKWAFCPRCKAKPFKAIEGQNSVKPFRQGEAKV